MTPVRVGIVNYLNTKPLLKGLIALEKSGDIELQHYYPAEVYTQFKAGAIDIALLPVATIKHLPQASIIGNHCIAADNDVASVCLFSQVPLEDIKTIILDYQSRTSVELVKILCNELWHITPEFIAADTDYIQKIQGTTAGVIIGDRALQQRNQYTHVYDLALGWQTLTGLPFVFAVWCSQIQHTPEFIDKFEQANAIGLTQKEIIAQENAVQYYDLSVYYTHNISYTLNADKRKAIDLFLHKIQ